MVESITNVYILFDSQYKMEAQERFNRRKHKLSNIRQSLTIMPLFSQTTLQLQKRLELNDTIKKTTSYCQKGNSTIYNQNIELRSSQKVESIFLDKYRMGDKIGQGAHGVVKKCYDKETNKLYAVKTIRLDNEHILFLKRNFLDIKDLHHRNIIEYKALFLQMNKQQCHLVMDYVAFPDLLHINIKSQQQLKEIVYEVLQALIYIHSKNICHRDIKPQNILYDEANKNIMIIDFGISKKLVNRGQKTDMLTITGTMYYRAPQMFQGGGYDEMVDLWALGATMYKLMTGSTPFQSIYQHQTIQNIIKGQFSFSPQIQAKYSKSARNLVSRLLKRRNERLTAKQALLDIWMIDLYQSADVLTRSLTNGNMLRIFGHSFKVSPQQQFVRTHTLKQNVKLDNTNPMSLTKLRQILTQSQQSMIYCQQQGGDGHGSSFQKK